MSGLLTQAGRPCLRGELIRSNPKARTTLEGCKQGVASVI